jgi:hypothetical protein
MRPPRALPMLDRGASFVDELVEANWQRMWR